MTLVAHDIEAMIHDIHAFFTDWVGGRSPGDAETFRRNALDLISDDLVAIFPAGRSFGKRDFERYMTGIYGTNPDFRIMIRDVRVVRNDGKTAIVNYDEWQRDARDSDQPNNGRVTTMVVGAKPSGSGAEILLVHETWLSDEVVAGASFDF